MGHIIEANRPILSVAEASALSGFTRTHINYLISQGQLDAVKVGSIWLVYEDSVRRYMASPHKPGPKPRADVATNEA
jgi:excisionase family DNA binding protein